MARLNSSWHATSTAKKRGTAKTGQRTVATKSPRNPPAAKQAKPTKKARLAAIKQAKQNQAASRAKDKQRLKKAGRWNPAKMTHKLRKDKPGYV